MRINFAGICWAVEIGIFTSRYSDMTCKTLATISIGNFIMILENTHELARSTIASYAHRPRRRFRCRHYAHCIHTYTHEVERRGLDAFTTSACLKNELTVITCQTFKTAAHTGLTPVCMVSRWCICNVVNEHISPDTRPEPLARPWINTESLAQPTNPHTVGVCLCQVGNQTLALSAHEIYTNSCFVNAPRICRHITNIHRRASDSYMHTTL